MSRPLQAKRYYCRQMSWWKFSIIFTPDCINMFLRMNRRLVILTTKNRTSARDVNNESSSLADKLSELWHLTFEEVGGEAGLVDRAIRHKLHPQLVGAGLEVVRLVVAAEAAQQRAALWVAVTHLQVVIGTVVMPLNLERQEWAREARERERQREQEDKIEKQRWRLSDRWQPLKKGIKAWFLIKNVWK